MKFLILREDEFNRQMKENEDALNAVEKGLDKLDMDLSDINGLVGFDLGHLSIFFKSLLKCKNFT